VTETLETVALNAHEDRFGIVATYYGPTDALLQEIVQLGQPERKPLRKAHGVCPYVMRTMDYDRYPQAENIADLLLQSDCIRLLVAYNDALPSRDKSFLWKRRDPIAHA
jgi:hypothetical protein